jgi:hypothetical protein
LFQFIDVDKDGAYTEGVDGIVNEYSFVERELLGYPGPKPAWDRGAFSSENKTMKIKTEDGVFAVTLKANEEVSTTPGGSTMTPMNTEVDIEINYNNYKELQAGNLVGLEAYVVTTTAGANAIGDAGQGLYVEQPGKCPMLGYTWDGEATSVSDGSTMEVKMSGVLDASLNEIESHNLILGGIGITAKVDAAAKVEVKKMNFVFNQDKAGNVKTYQGVGSASPDDNLVSGAGDIARWTMTFLSLLLSAASVLLNVSH